VHGCLAMGVQMCLRAFARCFAIFGIAGFLLLQYSRLRCHVCYSLPHLTYSICSHSVTGSSFLMLSVLGFGFLVSVFISVEFGLLLGALDSAETMFFMVWMRSFVFLLM